MANATSKGHTATSSSLPTGGFPTDNAEARLLVHLQTAAAPITGVNNVARGLSFLGEHAWAWLALGAAGSVLDQSRRRDWQRVFGAALVSHAASVVIKRIVRRPRPHAADIKIGVGTPSSLSFPSSHATSTTATMVSVSRLTGKGWPLAMIPVMALSRMVLGVHYPTDVSAGAALGATTALLMEKLV